MPFDPRSSDRLTIAPLLQLSASGPWQLELTHDRSHHLLIWVTRGQGRLMIEGSQRGFGPHTVIYVPARHIFSIEIGRQTLGQAIQIGESMPGLLPETPMSLRISNMQEQARINALLEAMQREQVQDDDYSQRSLRSYCDLLGVMLRRQAPDLGTQATKLSAGQRLSRAFCKQLAEDPSCAMNMADHANMLDVTPTHLTRVCKAETGKTAATLLTERQLHSARNLLVGSKMPMRDIADELGFGSAAYFTRFITQHTGEAPSQLRKSSHI